MSIITITAEAGWHDFSLNGLTADFALDFDVEPGEDEDRSGHPDYWTPGYAAQADLGDITAVNVTDEQGNAVETTPEQRAAMEDGFRAWLAANKWALPSLEERACEQLETD